MPSIQVTLVSGVPMVLPLDAPTGRVIITQEASATPVEIYATADGSLPIVPVQGVEIPSGQVNIPAWEGFQATLAPALTAGYMTIPTIRLLSVGTPTVTVSW